MTGDEHLAQLWDKQIEKNLETGRLDSLLIEVDDEYEAGLARPLLSSDFQDLP
jgi:hypothetical protein